MTDEDLTVRSRAADAVALIIGRRYRYDPNDSPAQRLRTISTIRQFWARSKNIVGAYHDKARQRRKDEAEK